MSSFVRETWFDKESVRGERLSSSARECRLEKDSGRGKAASSSARESRREGESVWIGHEDWDTSLLLSWEAVLHLPMVALVVQQRFGPPNPSEDDLFFEQAMKERREGEKGGEQRLLFKADTHIFHRWWSFTFSSHHSWSAVDVSAVLAQKA